MDIKAQIRKEAEKRYPIPSEGEYYLGNTTPSYIHFYNKQIVNRAKFTAGAEWMLSQSPELKKENERLIEMAYIAGRNDEKSKSKSNTPYTDGWGNFKTENNL